MGTAEQWDKAEAACLAAAESLGVPFAPEKGEAAFYGPKIDFVVRDVIGREWQLGTVQVDYQLPARFELTYVGADNTTHRPVMVHRAPFGSMERFIGVLIEHFGGAFPLWLSPEQIRICTVSEKSEAYGRQVEKQLKDAGFRVTGDYRPEKLGAKIRDSQLGKVPYTAVVGPKDEAAGTVSLRDRIDGSQETLELAAAIAKLSKEADSRIVRQCEPPASPELGDDSEAGDGY